MQRTLSPIDLFIEQADRVVRTLNGQAKTTGRPNPTEGMDDTVLDDEQTKLSARLMRVNHAGEVAAQALYQGQSLTARDPSIQAALQHAAEEENDHLAWCKKRVNELHENTSALDPLWYLGSFAIGATAGLMGDKWSLGFLAETEHQVGEHIQHHLDRLPENDHKTRAILEQMKVDEAEHEQTALVNGAHDLPGPVKHAMRLTSKVMTKSSFLI